MRTSEKCRNNKHNNNPDNPLTSPRTDGGKKVHNMLIAIFTSAVGTMTSLGMIRVVVVVVLVHVFMKSCMKLSLFFQVRI